MATKVSIDFSNSNLKNVTGSGIQYGPPTSLYQQSGHKISMWNDSYEHAVFATHSAFFRVNSAIKGYMQSVIRVQDSSNNIVDIKTHESLFAGLGYGYMMPLFTSSNPIYFSGYDTGSNRMELYFTFERQPNSIATASSYASANAYVRGLID